MKQPPSYRTAKGSAYLGDSLELIGQLADNSIDLCVTSPPFALQRQKAYGNVSQQDYVLWLAQFAKALLPKLKDSGSLVIDIGGSYEKGVPVRSLYPFRVAIHFCDVLGYKLAEDFYWHNPSKLPSPIEWVNKRKIRVKDSVNNVWWFSKTEWPKSDVSNVLAPYSDRMKKLIEDPAKFYTPKKRPSGHDIGAGFAKDNGGAIPPNLIEIPNTESNGAYVAACKVVGLETHPARFPTKLPEFFIKLLTTEGDTVLDIFAGSNTTGQVAESLKRKWISFDNTADYVAASAFRFLPKVIPDASIKALFDAVKSGENVDMHDYKTHGLELFSQA